MGKVLAFPAVNPGLIANTKHGSTSSKRPLSTASCGENALFGKLQTVPQKACRKIYISTDTVQGFLFLETLANSCLLTFSGFVVLFFGMYALSQERDVE